MSIYLGSSKISKVYIGGNEASAVYQGTTKIRPDIVPVTGVSLNTSSISFTAKNQTNQLTATVLPNNATNKNVIWSSSNTSVATVSSSGLVTCKGNGNCTITVTTQDGGYTATCGVTAVVPRIFTISWTEKSYMSSGWTYSDDAAGLTAGSGDFDDFFGYSAVLLNTSGTETAEMKQSGGVFTGAMSTLGNITSGDNVMIKFPVRGIKMSKSGSVVTLSITDGLDRESEGYQYYAHCTGTLDSPGTPKSAFYLGAYKSYNNSNVLKSWSGKTPTGSMTQSNSCTYSKSNGSGYNIMGFYQKMYISALYIMKYGNPNCQSVIGKGYTLGRASSPIATTGGTNSQTNATYGTSDGTAQIKLFGLEDRWGDMDEWLGGTYTNSSNVLYTGLTGWNGSTSGLTSTGITISSSSSNFLSSIAGDNKGMFAPMGAVSSMSYYGDLVSVGASYVATVSGQKNTGDNAGVFYLRYTNSATATNANIGSRLMYLQGLS